MPSFTLNETEEASLKKFQRHRCSHKDAQGYRPSPQFIVSPNAIGVGYEVFCSCGKRKDITDYDSW